MIGGFTWGGDGKAITPEEAKRRRELAQALINRGIDTSPVQHWTQGAARVASALAGSLQMSALDKQEGAAREEAKAKENALISALFGGGGSSSPQPATGAAPPSEGVTMPPGNIPPSLRASSDLIKLVEERNAKAGLPPGYLTRTAAIESNFNPQAKNPNSSASGLFQFIDSTRRQYGGFDPMDPVASTDAAARLASDNKAALARVLGREPTAGELYLAHQQGAGGASKLLSNPNARAVDVVGLDAVRFNGGDPGMSAADFASKLTGKFAQSGAPTSTPTASSAPANATPSQVQAAQGILNNPYSSPAAKAIAQSLIQRMITQETKDPLDIEKKRLEVQDLRNRVGRVDMETVTDPATGALLERPKGTGQPFQRVKGAGEKPPDRSTDQKELDQINAEREKAGFPPLRLDEWKIQKGRAGATTITNDITGGSSKQVFDLMEKRAEAAQSAAGGLVALAEARRAVKDGGIFGAGADQRLAFAKLGQLFGFEDGRVVNTETFRSAIAPQVAAMMKATVGSTQISNADREFAEKAAGGSITLDQKSIGRLLDIMERGSRAVIDRHNKQLDEAYPETPDGKFRRERALLRVDLPKAPDPASPANLPKPGDLVDGYVFKGGNPADPNSWQRAN